MTKDELIALRRERGKQELNIGDRVKVYDRNGNIMYGGKTAIIIEKALRDPTEFYYGLYVEGETADKFRGKGLLYLKNTATKIGKTALLAPFFAEDLELVKKPTDEIKVGDRVNTPQGEGKVVSATDGHIFVQLDNGDLWFNGIHEPTKLEDKPTDKISPNDIVRLKSNTPREYYANISRYYETMPFKVGTISKKSGGEWMADITSCDRNVSVDIPVRFLKPYYSAEDVRRMEEEQNKRAVEFLREHSDNEADNSIKENDIDIHEVADEWVKNVTDAMEEYRKGFAKITSELVDFDWQQYRTELASKIAVAYAEKGRYKPSEIGEFAVMVANDVVDNLKKQSE